MATLTCPHCGQEHPAEARFCPVTGKTLDAKNKCPHCGAIVQNNWRVCPRCGIALAIPAKRAPFFLGSGWTWATALIVVALILGITGAIIFRSRFRNAPPPALAIATNTKTRIEATMSNTAFPPVATVTATELIMASPIPTTATPPTSTEPQGKIVFACQLSRDPAHNQLCLINADGSDWKRLSTDDTADYTYPTFTPDGKAVIVSLNKFGSNQLYEIDLSGNLRQLSELTSNAYAPALSPDNRQIVFTVNDGSRQTIWIMDRDGTNAHQITESNRGEDWDPVWSPEGTQIVFASNREGAIQLFVMNTDGSNVHRLTNVNDLRGRSDWSPDAKILSTYKGPAWHREIILLSPDGKELTQLTNGGNNLAPNFSPDGQWIAFTSYRDHVGDENGCEIYIMRIDGSQVTRLTNNDYCDWQPNWGP